MSGLVPTSKAIAAFVAFIRAREAHRIVKEDPKVGWGNLRRNPDPIIAKYRFCNVRRNDDRVTKWIHQNYLDRWREHPDLWFALVVSRLFNSEDTLSAIHAYVLPFKPDKMRAELHQRAKVGKKNFNAAYIVSTNGRAMNKIDYVIQHILTPMWKHRGHLSHFINKQEMLSTVHQLLSDQNGLASFMAAQVVADLKYANPNRWVDFHTFAASGPGSKRGLNRVLGRDKETPMSEAVFRATLATLRDSVNARLDWEPITAQDIQNCLCEYDKYQRAATGDGEPKQLYKPKEN